MCQIFGYNGNRPIQLNDVLREFYSHSDKHPNGWGLALLDGTHANIERETLPAYKSAYLKGRLEEPIFEQKVLAHIRYATIGNIERKNCHPFTGFDMDGRRWTLIHNGTIFDFPPMDGYIMQQQGDTDSERILLYLIDQINRRRLQLGHALTREERFGVLEEVIAGMAEGNKLNLLIYDGEVLYAHTNLEGSLHVHRGDYGVIFATEPLIRSSISFGKNQPGEKHLHASDWERVPTTILYAYENGERSFEGKPHGYEYHENPDAVNMLYWDFSSL